MKSERMIVAGVLLLFIWLPLPMGSDMGWSMGLYVAMVGALFLLWGWQSLKTGRVRNQSLCGVAGVALLLLLITQLWVAIQYFAGISENPGRTMEYWLVGLAHAGVFALIVRFFDSRRRINALLGTLVISGVLHAFYSAAIALTPVEWLVIGPDTGRVVSGVFANRNHMAGYLELTLACGIGLMLALRDERDFEWRYLLDWLVSPKALLRLGLVIMVIALVMTRSRTGNVAFFSSLLLLGGLFVVVTPQHRMRNILILVSVLVIDVLVISQWFGLEELRERLVNTQLQERVEVIADDRTGLSSERVVPGNVLRDDINAYGLRQWSERPWLGFGAGSFESTFQQFPGREIELLYDDAHNDVLQFAIEFGLLGSLPLVVFYLAALGFAVNSAYRADSGYSRGVGLGVAIGLFSLLVHSFTDANLQIPSNAAVVLTLAAIAYSAQKTHRIG